MNTSYPSIDYKIHSSLIGDSTDWIAEINGEVTIDEEEGEEILVAKCRHFFIDLENSGHSADYLFDTRSELVPFIGLYITETASFTDNFLDIVDNDVWSQNLLIIDRIEILPPFRGKGLAKLIIDDAINLFSPRTDVIALKIFPFQLEYKHPRHERNKWERMMTLDELEKNEKLATTKLENFYKSLGFIMTGDSNVMVKIIT